MRTSSTRREAIKTALKAGAYATPVLLAATVPMAVAAVTAPPATATVMPPPLMSADLALGVTTNSLGSSSNGVFNVTAANLGPTPASNVVVTITHAATLTLTNYGVTQGTINPTTGIWSVGTLPVNMGATLTVSFAGTGNITFTITSSTPDPNPANNTVSFPIT